MTIHKEKKDRILTMFCIFGSAPWTRRTSAMAACPFPLAQISAVNPFCLDQYDDKRRYLMATQKEKKERILTLFCIFGSAPWTRRSTAVAVCPFKLACISAVNPSC